MGSEGLRRLGFGFVRLGFPTSYHQVVSHSVDMRKSV